MTVIPDPGPADKALLSPHLHPVSLAQSSFWVPHGLDREMSLTHVEDAKPDGSSVAPPNIVLIMVDDMGYESVEAYGGVAAKTPALNQLAEEGVRFEHAYSQPLCTPTRVKIMTGLFNFRNYVRWSKMRQDEVTFARYFRDLGYRTLLAGKWQLNSDGGQRPWDVENGFDEVITRWGGGEDQHPYWGHQVEMYQDGQRTRVKDPQAFLPDLFAAFTLDFIRRSVSEDQPFFVYRPMLLPHSPEICTPDQGTGPNDCDLSGQDRYTAMVEYMDKEVAGIINELEQLGIRDNTLVMFTSDNGAVKRLSFELRDGTKIQGGKGDSSDSGTRVPFIVSWPGVVAMNQTNSNPIDFSVVVPTLLHAAMNPLAPASELGDVIRPFDGPSIFDELRGEAGNPRGWAYVYHEPKRPNEPPKLVEFIRDERYKLYRSGSFFDIREDVREQRSIGEGEGGAEAIATRARLQRILDEIQGCEEVCKYNCHEQACAVADDSQPLPPADGIGTFRHGFWIADLNHNQFKDSCAGDRCFGFGVRGDIPVVGDWKGLGFDSVGVFRQGVWYLDLNGNNAWDGCDTDGCIRFGAPHDIPVVGDWTGLGFDSIGVFRQGVWYPDLNGNNAWDGCDTDGCIRFGAPHDIPVVGDWTGLGFDSIGVFRRGAWYPDLNGNNRWDGCEVDDCIGFGTAGDIPVVGDWTGLGFDSIGVFRRGAWYFDLNGSRTWDGCDADDCIRFGNADDHPVAGQW